MEPVNALENAILEINNLLDGSGWVKVVKVSPETHPEGHTPEYLVAKAARASYNSELVDPVKDRRLVQFLARNHHTSPLEMCSITFCMKLPIAICRQLLRHRTGKFNEFSQRYSEVTDEVDRFRLDKTAMGLRGPDKTNKQASGFNLTPQQIVELNGQVIALENLQDEIFQRYKTLIKSGLAKEVARMYLPVSTYTKIYVQFDLNNLVKFLRLRCAPDAQYEIQVYANAMKELAKQFFPAVMELEEEYKDGLWMGKYEEQMIRERRIPEEVKSVTHKKQLRELAQRLNIELQD
jgi:thymidylate synthase (FAD)